VSVDEGSLPYIQEMFDILGREIREVTSEPMVLHGSLASSFFLKNGEHYTVFQFVFMNQFLTPEYLVTVYENIEKILRTVSDLPGIVVLVFPTESQRALGRIITVNAASLLSFTAEIHIEIWFIDYNNSTIESLLFEEFITETGNDILGSLNADK
jgi:hypothetical protein